MNTISLWELFWTFLKVNTITFGGGYTIVPVLRDIFVEEKKVISENEMDDLIALAQGGPGAMAISTSILTGYKLKGPIGAFVCLLASVVPCLVILSCVSIFYSTFRKNFFVNSSLDGISGCISAVLLITVFNMAKRSYNNYKIFTVIVFLTIFVLGFFIHVKTAYLIPLCAISGIIVFSIRSMK